MQQHRQWQWFQLNPREGVLELHEGKTPEGLGLELQVKLNASGVYCM